MNFNFAMTKLHKQFLVLFVFALAAMSARADTWWNNAWTARQKITLDTTAEGGAIATPVGGAPVLLRLYDGNFAFDTAREDGSDLRFVAADGKTVLAHQIERYDRSLNEAFIWVTVPAIAPGARTTLYVYSGSTSDGPAVDSKAIFDADTTLVYHFSESGLPVDSSKAGNNATATSLPVAGALIAGGVRLTGQLPVSIPASESLAWAPGGALTWSAWIKPVAFRSGSVIFSRREGANAFIIGENNGVPFAEIVVNGTAQRTTSGEPLVAGQWTHLAVTVSGGSVTLWRNGESYATVAASLPALAGPSALGKDEGPGATYTAGFNGEVDELQIAKVARSPGWLKFAALSQSGSPEAEKLIVVGQPESGAADAAKPNFFKEHFGIFADISKSLTVDGWAVIILCAFLASVGAAVAISKLRYLNRIEKASASFIKRWDALSNDITALDRASDEELKTLGGTVTESELALVRESPLFHIYHLGAQEIRKRIEADGDNFAGLSVRSIEAIKARLDGGLVDEEEKLNSKLVFLTLGIAGGPYLGLLGTVIGVMITFAVIAKSGEVEVNSIAPGIAGALLATVAGLAVAIPALFSYSYLQSRITSALNGTRKFIDEFITRIAEAYPTKD